MCIPFRQSPFNKKLTFKGKNLRVPSKKEAKKKMVELLPPARTSIQIIKI